jgi:hypothetical protein
MPPCNTLPTVIASANTATNTGMGGHLTQHVYGLLPPPGTSQLGKTLFSGKGKFDAAWRQYRYVPAPCNCGGGGQAQQVVTLAQLHMGFMDAFSCTAADPVTGACTAYNAYMAQAVFFGFLLVNGIWILNTAFPIPQP